MKPGFNMMDEDFKNLMSRIKNLSEYEVQYPLPSDFEFRGVIPFDKTISGGVAFVKVVALTLEEAVNKVDKFFENGYDHE